VKLYGFGVNRTPTRADFGVRLQPSGWGGGSPVSGARASDYQAPTGARVSTGPRAPGDVREEVRAR
jgi:hypothetical protein